MICGNFHLMPLNLLIYKLSFIADLQFPVLFKMRKIALGSTTLDSSVSNLKFGEITY